MSPVLHKHIQPCIMGASVCGNNEAFSTRAGACSNQEHEQHAAGRQASAALVCVWPSRRAGTQGQQMSCGPQGCLLEACSMPGFIYSAATHTRRHAPVQARKHQMFLP